MTTTTTSTTSSTDSSNSCDPTSASYDGSSCPPTTSTTSTTDSSNCDPNYEGACVPMDQADINCSDVSETNFKSVGTDPYNLDADKDGIACEA